MDMDVSLEEKKQQCIQLLRGYSSKLHETFFEKSLLKPKIFDTVLNEAIDEAATILVNTLDSEIPDILVKYKTARVVTKKRTIYADKSYENSEYNTVFNVMKSLSSSNQEYIDVESKTLDWANDIEAYAISYMFTYNKTARFRKSSVKTDMLIELISFYIHNISDKNSAAPVERMVNSLTKAPIDNTNSVRNSFGENNKFLYNSGAVDYIFELDSDAIRNGTYDSSLVESSFSILNKRDVDILNYILKVGVATNPSFLEDGKVKIPIADICKNVFKFTNKRYNNEAKKSIIKMANIKIHAYTKNGTIITKQPLYKGDILSKQDTGLNYDMADIIVNEDYLQDIVKGNFIDIYSDIVEKLENKDAKQVIFNLQKERFIMYYASKVSNIVEPLVKRVDYRRFGSFFVFTNKRKDVNIKRIVACLDAIKSTGQILLDYVHTGDYFTLYFAPFTEEEKEYLDKCIQSNTKMFTDDVFEDSDTKVIDVKVRN